MKGNGQDSPDEGPMNDDFETKDEGMNGVATMTRRKREPRYTTEQIRGKEWWTISMCCAMFPRTGEKFWKRAYGSGRVRRSRMPGPKGARLIQADSARRYFSEEYEVEDAPVVRPRPVTVAEKMAAIRRDEPI